MQQTWHIFKKDLLFLRLEILNYLGAILVAGWLAAFSISVAEILVAFTAAYLIAGLIHAEAPAGDRQFWVTRPYRWRSLLAAKLLFILAVVGVPVLFAQLALVVHGGFGFAAYWPGLLWEQVLLFCCVYIPMAALAALTPSLVSFISVALIAALADIGIQFLGHAPALSLRSMDWVRSSFDFIVLLAASVIVLSIQYWGRQTGSARIAAAGILIPGVLASIFLPWSLAFAVQHRLSTQPLDPSTLSVALNSQNEQWGLAPFKGKRVMVSLFLELQGLPPGTAANPEALEISLRSSSGRDSLLTSSDLAVPRNVPNQSGRVSLTDRGEMDRNFFEEERDRPVTLHGSLYLSVFGNIRTHTIDLRSPDKPVDITDKLRCFVGEYGMSCNSPFRWPDQWIGISGISTALSLYYPVSHSPFPAELRFYPFEDRWAPPPARNNDYRRPPVTSLTIEVAEPVAYVRREFEIRDVHLTDIAVPWRSQREFRGGKTISQNEY